MESHFNTLSTAFPESVPAGSSGLTITTIDRLQASNKLLAEVRDLLTNTADRMFGASPTALAGTDKRGEPYSAEGQINALLDDLGAAITNVREQAGRLARGL